MTPGRHAMFVDQEDESCLIPLNEAIPADKGRLELANSEYKYLILRSRPVIC